jgi:hypothetical protein
MQWFKHSKDFRNSAEIKFLEGELGEAGYARFCKLLEVIATVAGKKKPFKPQIRMESPYTWQWMAMELGVMAETEYYGTVPDEREAARTIGLFEKAGLVSIEETAEYVRKSAVPGKQEVEVRPHQFSVYRMTDWCEWHDLSNRNRKKKPDTASAEARPENGKPSFSGMKTP